MYEFQEVLTHAQVPGPQFETNDLSPYYAQLRNSDLLIKDIICVFIFNSA